MHHTLAMRVCFFLKVIIYLSVSGGRSDSRFIQSKAIGLPSVEYVFYAVRCAFVRVVIQIVPISSCILNETDIKYIYQIYRLLYCCCLCSHYALHSILRISEKRWKYKRLYTKTKQSANINVANNKPECFFFHLYTDLIYRVHDKWKKTHTHQTKLCYLESTSTRWKRNRTKATDSCASHM